MSTKLYGKDLKEYEEIDVESLLAKLSFDELSELNNDIDPDNSLLPPALRCRDQTEKEATGPYNREQLLHYLEEKAKNEKDWDENVPFTKDIKRGKTYLPKDDTVAKDTFGEMPIELDVDEEFSEAINGAHEKDLVDLAGILGMHNLINQMQYYNALKGVPQEATFSGIVKSTALKLVPDEPPNSTDVDACIEKLQKDDPSLTEINVNNMKHIPREKLIRLIEATKKSTHLEKLSLANTATADAEMRGLIEVLEQSKSLKNLNVESNFISGDLLAKLIRATLKTQTLKEFHAENQRSAVLGNKIETDIAKSIEENDTILRVGISFQGMEARYRVADALEHNYERIRLKRLGMDV